MTCTCDDLRSDCDNSCQLVKPLKAMDFNRDPAWQKHVLRYEPVIQSIAAKFCESDEDLRQDLIQDAMINLLTVRPETVKGYDEWVEGKLDDKKWQKRLDSYCGNVIRNSILSYLDSYVTGNWYIGRTRHIRDRKTGKTRKIHLPPRYSSLNTLMDEFGAQIDEEGQITWRENSDDGLLNNEG
jgi:hypothetical protein